MVDSTEDVLDGTCGARADEVGGPVDWLCALAPGHHRGRFHETAGGEMWGPSGVLRGDPDLTEEEGEREDADVGDPLGTGWADSSPGDALPPEPESERAAYLRGLRELADWLERHPEVALPWIQSTVSGEWRPTMSIFLTGENQRDELAVVARAMADGGKARKHARPDDDRFHVLRDFAGITLHAQAARAEVCERVVVGTEQVEVEVEACPECGGPLKTIESGASVCEADPGHYRARKPGKRVETTEREIVEWRCSPLLTEAGESA